MAVVFWNAMVARGRWVVGMHLELDTAIDIAVNFVIWTLCKNQLLTVAGRLKCLKPSCSGSDPIPSPEEHFSCPSQSCTACACSLSFGRAQLTLTVHAQFMTFSHVFKLICATTRKHNRITSLFLWEEEEKERLPSLPSTHLPRRRSEISRK